MKIDLNFGRGTIPLDVDDAWDYTIVRKRTMPVEKEPKSAIQRALENPVNTAPLSDKAKSCRNACILICDITRPVPNQLILPKIVSILLQSGIPRENIEILIATGLHRPNEG